MDCEDEFVEVKEDRVDFNIAEAASPMNHAFMETTLSIYRAF